MKAADWSELKSSFATLSTQAHEERERVLVELRCQRPEFAAELEALLRNLDAGAGVTGAVGTVVRDFTAQARDALIGTSLGPWHITAHLGQGGMSDVYSAERRDGAYQMRAAVKVYAGRPSAEALQRFAQERQILARLEHPNIARILDGGTTAGGLPYLVLEHVTGIQIDAYCVAHELAPRARLELFRKICGAVEYAHQNLIVHRDLKPSNILVTAQGEPKLLDFGIAKLLPEAQRDGLDDVTRAAARALTPDFASPEQVSGKPITTRSDVYSLGVLLYLLLSGRRPYTSQGLRASEFERLVCETQPPRPSVAAVQPGTGSSSPLPYDLRALRGDLDEIVMRALRKEPPLRYASVSELSADLRRHLEGLPVAARGRTFPYLLRKFVRRNALPLTASATLVAVTVGAAIYHNRTVTLERDRVGVEAANTAAVVRYLTAIFGDAAPDRAKGETITAREILERGVSKLSEDETMSVAAHAKLRSTFGEVYTNMGFYDRALEQFRKAAERYRDIGDAEGRVRALVGVGDNSYIQGEYADSVAASRDCLQEARRLRPPRPALEAACLLNVAEAESELGSRESAAPVYLEVIQLLERAGITREEVYVEALNNYAQLLIVQGRPADAEAPQRKALEIATELWGEQDSKVTQYLQQLGVLLHEVGRLDEAEPLLLRATAHFRERLGPDHSLMESAHMYLARLHIDQRRYDEADRDLTSAIAVGEKAFGPRHVFVAYDTAVFARLRRLQGRLADSEALYRRALDFYRGQIPDDHAYVGNSRAGLSATLLEARRAREALVECEAALRIYAKAYPAQHPETARTIYVRGRVLRTLERIDDAAAEFSKSYEMFKSIAPQERTVPEVLGALVEIAELRGDGASAEKYRALLRR